MTTIHAKFIDLKSLFSDMKNDEEQIEEEFVVKKRPSKAMSEIIPLRTK